MGRKTGLERSMIHSVGSRERERERERESKRGEIEREGSERENQWADGK